MRKMGIGLGVGINRSNYAQGIFNAYSARVVADGGVVEGGTCVDAVSSLLQSASLLLIPSGYKGGKLYAEIPTNGNGDLTWTRGSDAFRTNASGVIQRVPWNLLSYSEQFTNAVWTASNSTITANTTTAPNGTLTADTIASTTIGSETRIRQTIVQVANTTYTLSCYAKKGTVNWFIVRNLAVNSTAGRAWFNLNTGTIGTVNSGLTASIENVGDGWYRCTISGVANGATNLIDLAPALNDGAINATSVGESVFIWGAQLVEGTTAQTYLPTTDRLNFPRLSYMYGSCPSALLEPQRTNLVLQSQDFDNASWGKTNSSVTANNTTAPDGTNTADLIIENSANSGHLLIRPSLSLSSGAYSITVYAKAKERSKLMIFYGGTIAKGYGFDLANGTTSAVTGVTSADSFAIASVGNGWYRCQIGINSSTLTQLEFYLLNSFTSYIYTGDGTSGLYLWGAQIEAGSYPTTYIPTTSATATRVADSFSRSNIYTNGLISASGGTWFVELRGNTPLTRDNGGNNLIFADAVGTTSFRFRNDGSPNSRLRIQKIISGTITDLLITPTDTCKIAIKWNGTSADVFVNGTKEISATSFTATQLQDLTATPQVPTFIQQMALFNSPLTDAQCQTLTTL